MHFRKIPLGTLRDLAEEMVTVAAAVEAGVLEALAGDGATLDELVERTGLDRRAVAILLPVLEELDVVQCRKRKRFRLTALGRRAGDPSSDEYEGGGLPLWLENLRAWTRLGEALRTGGPLEEETVDAGPAAAAEPEGGAGAEPDPEAERASLARFMAAMAAAPASRVQAAARDCLERNPAARSVLDLGGGPGHYARAFASEGLEVTLLDRPETVDFVAEEYGLRDEPGIRLVGADFLEDELPAGPFDIVLLSNVLHIYPPATGRELLRKVARVTSPGGLVAIGEMVRGESPRAARFGLVMLLRTEGGDTYTAEEYAAWLTAAGFDDCEIEDLEPDRQLITAVRRWEVPAE